MSELYALYDSNVDLTHKKRFGQFFTDERVARFMVGWVLALGAHEIYDPAFGLGAFYLASKAINKSISFAGSEVDSTILNFWRERNVLDNLSVSLEDYLRKWGVVRPAIVCNPPYMRFQRFLAREEVFKTFEEHLGLKLSGYTNIASAFLIKSVSELSYGGRLAYVMPLEFLNTGYGTLVKRQMITEGLIHAIIRLDCEKDAFPDVTTSSGIILFEKTATRNFTRYYVVRELGELEQLLDRVPENVVKQDQLQPHEKWFKYFDAERLQMRTNYLAPLSTYGAFSRGIATGANKFFALKPSQIASLGLTNAELVRCVTKSSQIRKPVFTDCDFNELASADTPVFLLNVNAYLSEQAARYIRHGEEQAFNKRYLTRFRNPWYRLESRQPSPLLFGVFSRDGYKVIRNYSKALNLTCYHGFQPNLFGLQFVDHLFLYLMSAAGRKILALNMRKYGDSLDKFEPNDLNHALAPSIEWFSRIGEQEAREEVEGVILHGRLSSKLERVFDTLVHTQQLLSADDDSVRSISAGDHKRQAPQLRDSF